MMLPAGRRQYFERLYRDDPDPWRFASSAYEQRKYGLTLASLPHPRYHRAFEPGCSIGVLTAGLARRCDSLLATDLVPAAARACADRLADQAHVRVVCRDLADGWPAERFDLVVLSEIAYYFAEPQLRRLVRQATSSLEPEGTLLAVHWRGETDYALTGDQAHRVIDGQAGLRPVVHHQEPEFLLDAWERS
jgi:cyclopropane fatty-acyl-phospholipid synthase-like methyltransferase